MTRSWNRNRAGVLVALLIPFATPSLQPTALAAESAALSAYLLEVSPHVTLAGELNAEMADQLPTDITVIDLRTEAEGTATEAERFAELNVPYVNIPIGPEGLSESTVDQFAQTLQKLDGRRAVIHCRSGNRAALLWAVHLMNQGQSADEAYLPSTGY